MAIKFIELDSIKTICGLMGAKVQHPLITFVDCSKLPPQTFNVEAFLLNYYVICLKVDVFGKLHYGLGSYRHDRNSLMFFAPGQKIGVEADGVARQLNDRLLMVHPDFLQGTDLGHVIKHYPFFRYEYEADEVLLLAEKDRKLMSLLLGVLDDELEHYGESSGTIVVDLLKLILDFCDRLYHRQSQKRHIEMHDTLLRLEDAIDGYFHSAENVGHGKLSVEYCAGRLGMSTGSLSATIKRELGISPLCYIDSKILGEAKARLCVSAKNIGSIASELGFSSPSYFSKWFENKTGRTPNDFRKAKIR